MTGTQPEAIPRSSAARRPSMVAGGEQHSDLLEKGAGMSSPNGSKLTPSLSNREPRQPSGAVLSKNALVLLALPQPLVVPRAVVP